VTCVRTSLSWDALREFDGCHCCHRTYLCLVSSMLPSSDDMVDSLSDISTMYLPLYCVAYALDGRLTLALGYACICLGNLTTIQPEWRRGRHA
jgi:hypothetical protein